MLKISPQCGFVALLFCAPLAQAGVAFNRDIRPLLSENCFACHGPDKDNIKAGLRLDQREWALRPAKSGDRAIVPGKPEESELLKRIVSGDADEVMPPPKEHKQMTQEQVALLRQWIAEGAHYEGHWAFQPPQRPVVPPGEAPHPVDAFIRARLKKEGLAPAPEAARETLIRRVTLDLTGLPPTSAEVAAFVRDSRPGAYERVVDRILAAPAYGEHMAQQWLDFARYADSNGFQADYSRQQWPWRDWVIDSFNRNQPFDEFTVEQIAGDLLPDPTRSRVVATGFHRNHRLNGEGGLIPEEWFVETVIDRVETTGLTWLGLTLNCCRCHDHKYDPITQKEFFQFFAFFNSVDETGTLRTESGKAAAGNTDPVLPLWSPAEEKQAEILRSRVREAERASVGAKGGTPELKAARAEEKKFMSSVPSVMVMKERQEPRQAFVLKRGEYDKPGEPVGRGVPASLPPLPEGAPLNRLGLAQWMVADTQPLTARVWVNRVWERLFGVGIVKTSENFGAQAEWPAHLDLLDWLAVEFMRPTVLPSVNGASASRWDRKALLKFLVLSETYRQSSQVTPRLLERDPENRLLARGPRFRLSGEAVRDQALALSGLLVAKVGGPSVRPYMPAGVWDETTRYGDLRGYKPDQGAGLYRRSLYTLWKRTAAPPSMLLFDAPTREICAVKRSRSNTPLQALSLLNEVTYVEAARALAQRMLREGGATHSARLAWAFRVVTGREGLPGELAILEKGLLARLESYRQQPGAAADLIAQGASKADPTLPVPDLAAYTLSANVLLNLDEVITRE
jgi:hypothetical protein